MTNFYDLSVIKDTPHHPAMNELVDLLCHRTNNIDRGFFQAEVAYFLGLVPSAMRVTIDSKERGKIPINIYSIALATSGFGKGFSVNILEDVIADFKNDFMKASFNEISEQHLHDLAINIAAGKGTDEAEERRALDSDFKKQGHAPFIFDSGTGPAVKQLRYKLLLANCGAINFQMDEIGSNLLGNNEVLNVFLELYDLGKIKAKLVKNTPDNERGLDLPGSTPANALMFGTTSKLFDGSKVEDEFYQFLSTGYARRCFFGVAKPTDLGNKIDPERLYDSLVNQNKSNISNKWRAHLASFADPSYHEKVLSISKAVGVELISYRLECETQANAMPEHEEIRKAELSHRYFKALKLAGVYAFLDDEDEISKKHIRQGIKVAEESGESFLKLLSRERNFVRLAKYISAAQDNLTHADLVEDLPFYPTSTVARKEMMDLAMAWGVSNHVVITKNTVQQVEFFSGSALEETKLNELTFSYSDHFAYNYEAQKQGIDKLPILLEQPGLHWCNHSFEKEHRLEDNVIQGFNMLVLDIDGTVPLHIAQDLMKDYTFITATTKRHTEDENRFRLIMPINYNLNLSKDDYEAFMESVLLWLPFEVDSAANQRSRKWQTFENSEVFVNKTSKLLDALPFIPKTKANSEYVQSVVDLGNLDNLQRWFINNMESGNRNNCLLKYGMMLKDAGLEYGDIENEVLALNKNSPSPLKEDEVRTTVLKSVAQKVSN